MRTRKTGREDIPALKALWQEAFGDEQQDIDLFFETVYPNATGFCAEDGGELVSMLFALPQTIVKEEKQLKCVLAPRRPPHHPPRDGSIDLAEDHSVPEGQAKSEQAPIRRPPCARRATAPERAKRFSLWTVHGPFLFWQDQKRNGGCICPAISMAESPVQWDVPLKGDHYVSPYRPK